MNINELSVGQGKIELQAEVIEKGDARTFEKDGNEGQVCNAVIKDETGTIKLSLWNDQVDQVNVGSIVKISNGYVSEFRDEMQLSTGKFGQLEVVGSNDALKDATKDEISAADITDTKAQPINESDFVDVEEETIE